MPIQLNLIGVDFSLAGTAGQKVPGKAAEVNGRAATFPANEAAQSPRAARSGGREAVTKPTLTENSRKNAAGRAAGVEEAQKRSPLLAALAGIANDHPAKKTFSAVMAETIRRPGRAMEGQVAEVPRMDRAPRRYASKRPVPVISASEKQTGTTQETGNLVKVSTSVQARQPRRGMGSEDGPTASGMPTKAAARKPAPESSRAAPQSPGRGEPRAKADKPAEEIGRAASTPPKTSVPKPPAANGEASGQPRVHSEARPKAVSFSEHIVRIVRTNQASSEAPQPIPATPAAVTKTPDNLAGTRLRLVAGNQPRGSQAAEKPGHRPVPTKAFAGEPKPGRRAGDAARPGLDVHVRPISTDPGHGQVSAAVASEMHPLYTIKNSQPAQLNDVAHSLTASGASEATPQNVADQIAAHLRATMGRDGQQVVIQLNPPELGRVKLTLLAEGKDLRGELKVSKPETLDQLRLEAPNLFRQLADSGVHVRRLDMSLDDQGLQQQSNWLAREGERQEQEGPGQWPEPQAQEFSPEQGPSHGTSGTTPQVVYGSDGSLNLWV
jgi:flagellar hook-length control protein FliK